MKIHPEIFKAYDIRGVYPREINKEIALQVGRAFYEFLRKDKKNPLTIVVGRDGRLSSNTLSRAIKEGIKAQGGRVIDIGLSTSPMFYFGVIFLKADGGAMVTASHNPPEYNGFKLVKEEAIPLSDETGINEIKRMIQNNRIPKRKIRGEEIKRQILDGYVKFNLKFLNQSKIISLKIVIDTANGVCGILIKNLSRNLKKIKIFHLFPELNGRFPNHNPDPLIKENLRFLQREVRKKKADFGISFDGDGDRIIFIDEKALPISGDLITALIAKRILRENPGEKILYDVRSSRVVKEIIKENRGVPVESRVGHSFMGRKMRKENAIFAGEFSAHYSSRENRFTEMPLFVLFKILEEVSRGKKPLSKVILPFKRYISSGEINFEIEDKIGTMRKVENYFKGKKGYKISHLDGVKIEAKDFWILVRPSNTEPLLRLSIEAKNKKILEQKTKEVKTILKI